jgi:hypothetical protein
MRKLLLTTVAALVLAFPAKADVITLTATVDGGAPTSTSSGTGQLNVNGVALGPFTLNTITANSQVVLASPELLDTNSLNVASGATGTHTLQLDIVASGLTGLAGLRNFLSTFSVSGLTTGWSARETTTINGALLADTGFFTTPVASVFSINPATIGGTFSADTHYTIVTNGAGSFNGGIDVAFAAVPGPLAGAGFPGLLAGMIGLWGLAKRRRNKLLGVA